MKYCIKCGSANEEGTKFCFKCGNPIGVSQQPQGQQTPVQQNSTPNYGNPAYNYYGAQNMQFANNNNPGKALSITALVLGIVATILSFIAWVNIISLACGIIGIYCACQGSKKAKMAGVTSGMATAGLVLSIVGTSFAGIGFLACTCPAICAVSTCASISTSFPSLY